MTDVGVGDGEWGQPSPSKKFQGREEVSVCVWGGGGGGGGSIHFGSPNNPPIVLQFLKSRSHMYQDEG